MLVGLLCRGHVLMLGVPGLGKTLMATHPGADARPGVPPHPVHARPDALGHHRHGHHRGRPGDRPAQARIPSRARSSPTSCSPTRSTARPPRPRPRCLQAMQEREVSIGRRTYPLNPPFFVVATQNPIEMEGTYPLPEAQLDRFMFNLKVEYPTLEEEVADRQGDDGNVDAEVQPVLKADELLRLQELVRGVPIADAVMSYAVRLVAASRPGRVEGDRGSPQVPALRGEPAGLAVPGPGRQGAGDPRGQVPRRFRRREEPWPARCCGIAWCSTSTPAPTAWTPTRSSAAWSRPSSRRPERDALRPRSL